MCASRAGYRTWGRVLAAAVLLGLAASGASAGDWWSIEADGAVRWDGAAAPQPAQVAVNGCDDSGLEVTVDLAGVALTREQVRGEEFISVSWPGRALLGAVGQPALPVVRELFIVPEGASVTITVRKSEPTVLDLREAGFTERIVPMQAPLPKVPEAFEHPPFPLLPGARQVACLDLDEASYSADELLPAERVTISELGMVRGQRLYMLEVHPVAYNPVRSLLRIWPHVEVDVAFEGGRADHGLGTMPALHGALLNPSAPKLIGRGEGNYLIIVADDFADLTPFTDFVAAKAAQGFDVMVHQITPSTNWEGKRQEIKDYILSLWGTADAPDYLLLVGDSEFIPPWHGGGSIFKWTDLPYACMDAGDDWYPDLAIGRWTVNNEAQLQGVVDKTLYVEAGVFDDPSYVGRAAFLSGLDVESGSEWAHDALITTYMDPNGYQSEKLYQVANESTTQDVLDAFNAGCGLVCYTGHSNSYSMYSGPPTDQDDIRTLSNVGMYPVYFASSCSNAKFPTGDVIGETWLYEPDKAAVVFIGTTGQTHFEERPWVAIIDLHDLFFKALFVDGLLEVSPALQAAKFGLLGIYGPEAPVTRDYFETYILLGDPSLEVPIQRATKNYLIITAEDYVDSAPLNQFANAKAAQGLKVSIYSVPPGTTRETIKSYILSLWGTQNAPDYILLVGDTDGSSAGSNTIPHWSGQGSKHADSDLPYACMDAGDDWYPDLAIGRFSVRSVSMLQDVVDKTLWVEAGNFSNPDYVKRGAFLANSSTYGMAEPTHDWVIDNLFTPNDYVGIKIYGAEGGDTQDVIDAVNEGCLFAVYFGHSGSGGWWNPSFSQTNVRSLSNAGLYGLVFGWSCNTSHFSYDECFGETWQREPNKGAAAYISASDYIYWGSESAWLPSAIHEKSFFSAFFEDDIWEVGPAWQAGLYRFLTEYGGWDGNPQNPPQANEDVCRNFFEEFVLLGDPALHLPQPDGFSLIPTPASHELCSPPADQAVYTIEVGQLGTFNEPVTLEVTGAPAGATIDFDVNSQPPPYMSMMTIGNLSGAAGGDYSIVITGTSVSKQRSTNVELRIANDTPGTITLISPANGDAEVELMPEFVWESLPEAAEYDLQIATDPSFANIVYSVTVPGASHALGTPLGALTTYFWHVRARNSCGNSDYSLTYNFTTVNQLMPVTYDMLNGESGQYSYFDDLYNGDGDNTVPLAPLSNGLGELTDGVIATEHWNVTNGPYVGWNTIEPTITFHFAESIALEAVTIHVDDSGGGGGVVPPSDVTLFMGGVTLQFPVTDPPGSAPFAFTFSDLGLSGDTLEVTLEDSEFTTSRYMMLTEVKFQGGPNTGACCEGETCTVMTEDECLALPGEYQGDGTDCDPNPCITYESACLIISEVVDGTESGGCPKWIEITNTGLEDFAFLEGGIIIQTDDSTDVTVDVDLTGVTIKAGQAFVINSNQGGACGGAFPFIYGFEADFYTNVLFGDGTDRYIITDTADGSNLIDIYGEFGVDGAGEPWEYTEGYSYRLSPYNAGQGQDFAVYEWFFGGVGSLGIQGQDPTQLLLQYTTPKVHVYNHDCPSAPPGDLDDDGDVDVDDYAIFAGCLAGPNDPKPPPGCEPADFVDANLDGDGDVDLDDFGTFQLLFTGG